MRQIRIRIDRSPELLGQPLPFKQSELHLPLHEQPWCERGQLKGSNQTGLHALSLREAGNVASVEPDASCVRPQYTAHEIDQCRLAGTVRTNQGDPLSGIDAEGHGSGYMQSAEPLLQAVNFQQEAHALPRGKTG